MPRRYRATRCVHDLEPAGLPAMVSVQAALLRHTGRHRRQAGAYKWADLDERLAAEPAWQALQAG